MAGRHIGGVFGSDGTELLRRRGGRRFNSKAGAIEDDTEDSRDRDDDECRSCNPTSAASAPIPSLSDR